MKILQGRQARHVEEATLLAFREAGKHDMSPDIVSLFTSAIDVDKLDSEGERSIKAAVHGRYGRSATFSGERWFIPVPQLCFNTEPIPQLAITIQPYLVSPIRAETSYNSYPLTLVGTVGKPEVSVIAMTFLWALLNDDLGRFRLVAKDCSHTTWEVPGAKPVKLPNDFVNRLSQTLKQKSVAMWLEDFGSQGRIVAPQVVGSLLGLQSMGVAQPIPTGQQAWSEETIINALQGMAYTTVEAGEMFKRAAPNLRVNHTLEEAIRLALQQAGEGE